MESTLYAEVYFICMINVCLVYYWTARANTTSTIEVWLKRVLVSFLLNFTSNFLFTIFNGGLIRVSFVNQLAYFLKAMYFFTMTIGVFSWCGYAESELRSGIFDKKHAWKLAIILALSASLPFINFLTHTMFTIDPVTHAYKRHILYHVHMINCLLWSGVVGIRCLVASAKETEPSSKGHLRLTASFPLCILLAWVLSFVGESIPVICVCITVELLCLYTGTLNQQISMDKLTQVNNRQNLFGFMDYKLKNNDGSLYLLMMDVDFFKTINDTFGHLEGDEALTIVSSCLKRACVPFAKRPYIARYGGDEFIIVMEGSREDVDRLCNSINAILKEEAQRLNKQYRLHCSIGVAKFESGMDNKAFIAKADANLYEVKKDRQPILSGV